MKLNSAGDARLIALVAALVAFGVVVTVVAVTGGGDEDVSATALDCREVERPQPTTVELDRPDPGSTVAAGEPARAVIATSCGSFTVQLDTDSSPRTADSFAYLAENGAYDDTVFHRIVPDFVIQGGDPEGTGAGGPGYTVREAPPEGTTYTPGTVAMAKTPDTPDGTSESQFFVVTGAGAASLPPEYAVAGEVVEGMEVVEAIGALGGPDEAPSQVVTIDSVTIERG